ncbi:Uncharacterised protein [uncultured archaeon]|nr:Uncharacterised protein [uncultured archaeon]
MNENLKLGFKYLGISILAISMSKLGDYLINGVNPFKMMPLDREIQSGYVQPSKLEIKLEDLNNDGSNETLMKYDGKLYLLKIDKQENPIIQPYKIIPAQIVPQ